MISTASEVSRSSDYAVRAPSVNVIPGAEYKVECKFVSRPLAIGAVDEFVGKLLDLGADRGILYSTSGLTPNAVWRTQMAANPSIIPVNLEPAPPRVPGHPAGLDEADHAGWLDREIYRELIMAKQWTPWYARELEEDPHWSGKKHGE